MKHIYMLNSSCKCNYTLVLRLTVEEHLWFYGSLKGMEPSAIKGETQRMITDVGLPHKRKEVSKNLSGQFTCFSNGYSIDY